MSEQAGWYLNEYGRRLANSNATLYEKAAPGNHMSLSGMAAYASNLEQELSSLRQELEEAQRARAELQLAIKQAWLKTQVLHWNQHNFAAVIGWMRSLAGRLDPSYLNVDLRADATARRWEQLVTADKRAADLQAENEKLRAALRRGDSLLSHIRHRATVKWNEGPHFNVTTRDVDEVLGEMSAALKESVSSGEAHPTARVTEAGEGVDKS